MVGSLEMTVYTALLRCPKCGTTQHTWVRQGKFLPCNATLCEECSSLYPANENLFQIQLANSVTRSCSTVNANL